MLLLETAFLGMERGQDGLKMDLRDLELPELQSGPWNLDNGPESPGKDHEIARKGPSMAYASG